MYSLQNSEAVLGEQTRALLFIYLACIFFCCIFTSELYVNPRIIIWKHNAPMKKRLEITKLRH